jgi:polysaccharide biosynthesis protein PslG
MFRLFSPNRRSLALLVAVILITGLQVVSSGRWPLPQPAAAIDLPVAAAEVQTVNSKIGVHTRLTDEADPAKITETLQMVHDMGAPWDVEYFPWNYIQPNGPTEYDWTHADLVVNAAAAQGLKLVARIDGVPWWARPEKTTWRYLDRNNFPDYAYFLYAFASRYKGKVHYYVIWNEPNLSSEWGQRQVNPEDYTALLKLVYPRIKEADPDAVVVAAGLAPTLEPETSEWGLRYHFPGENVPGWGAALLRRARHPRLRSEGFAGRPARQRRHQLLPG